MLFNETFFYNADQTEAAYALPDETAIKDISCARKSDKISLTED